MEYESVYLFFFYFILHSMDLWGKPHFDTGIVNIDMNALYNVMMCML